VGVNSASAISLAIRRHASSAMLDARFRSRGQPQRRATRYGLRSRAVRVVSVVCVVVASATPSRVTPPGVRGWRSRRSIASRSDMTAAATLCLASAIASYADTSSPLRYDRAPDR